MSLTKLIKAFFGSQAARVAPPPSAASRSARHHWVSNPWHAVSIALGARACGKARGLNRVRFLSNEAPTLPLEGCDARTCTCRYRHHEDRRREPRRASDVLANRAYWAGKERRQSIGRRDTDAA
jgi:hypothetical protein